MRAQRLPLLPTSPRKPARGCPLVKVRTGKGCEPITAWGGMGAFDGGRFPGSSHVLTVSGGQTTCLAFTTGTGDGGSGCYTAGQEAHSLLVLSSGILYWLTVCSQ